MIYSILRRNFRLYCVALLIVAAPAGLLAQQKQGKGKESSPDLRQAADCIRDGKTAEALAAVQRELAANPTSAAAANLLDTLGETQAARAIFQKRIAAAPDAAAKATAQRALAMSYAFTGESQATVALEKEVIAYWATRESAEPQLAFYQQGEMANEAARVCIDSGDLDAAEYWYRKGTELGLKEPAPKTHPQSLWEFRLAHALGRLAARRGNQAEAERHIAAARAHLDRDPKMAEQQERYFPYLVGYVALYTGDLKRAETELTKAMNSPGAQSDPFLPCLLGQTCEQLGQKDRALAYYRQAYALATAHNPPAAHVRPFARKRLGL
jgi:tetratricopeptide (TPR) repeat protein